MAQRAVDEFFELARGEGFFDKVERAVTHGIDGGGHGSVGGDHGDLRFDFAFLERADEFESAHSRHAQVGDDHVVLGAIKDMQRFRRATASADFMAGEREGIGH
jgi:hypothetical protein